MSQLLGTNIQLLGQIEQSAHKLQGLKDAIFLQMKYFGIHTFILFISRSYTLFKHYPYNFEKYSEGMCQVKLLTMSGRPECLCVSIISITQK